MSDTVSANPTESAGERSATPTEAPDNNLPSYGECRLRVANSQAIDKRVAEGGVGNEGRVPVASELHKFIYEYDDADPYRSAWFLHRLERLLDETKKDATATARQRIEGLEAEHKKYACHGESLLQTLHRLMSAANNHEGNAKGLANQLRDARATATAAESRLAAVEADAARYRWLREQDDRDWNELFRDSHDGLDTAIDSAIRHLKEKS